MGFLILLMLAWQQEVHYKLKLNLMKKSIYFMHRNGLIM